MRHTNKRKPLHLSLALLLPGLVLFGAVTVLTNSLPLLGNDSEAQANQSIPYRINFQGRLTDNNGNILPDGNYNMRFRFYDAPSGGTQQWSENRTGGDRVQLSNGLFNLQFGEVASLPPSVFSTYPLYLEVELPTPSTNTSTSPDWSEGPFTPRQRIASTPYAFNADQLDGRDSSEFAQLDPGSQQSGSINIGGNIQAGGSLQGSSLNVSGGGSFTGQVSGGDAQNSNEFTTLSQLQSAAGDAADSGVTSLQGLDGALTIQGTAQIDVGTSGGTTIGLALHADSIGNEHLEYNTGQHLTTTSSPTFAAVTAGFFTGDGSGLTNLNASNIISGTVADARLSSNVALLNANQTFTGDNVFNGQLSIGTASQLGQLTLGNNQWITGVNAAGNGGINMMRVNEQNQIQLGASLAIDGGFNFPTDGGLVTFTDMQVTDAPSSGSPMGYALRLDSDNMLTFYGEADGSGGTQNRQLQAFADLSFQQSASISTTSGDLTLSPAGDTIIDSDLDVNGAVTADSFSGDGSGLTSLNASNISSGTLTDSRLSSNVTLQGNTFNGANQLVQLNGSGHLPVLNASNLTNLNASNISSGTLADARLSSNVALLNANANFTASLQQGGNDVCTIAGNCAGQGGMGDILQGGNSFGTAMNIGTNDGFDLNLRTNGLTRLTVTSGGDVGIGTDSPQAGLDVDGDMIVRDQAAFQGNVTVESGNTLRLEGGASFPGSPEAGEIHYDTNTNRLYTYNGERWTTDRSTTNAIIASSDSQYPEQADYVIPSSSDSAQTVINDVIDDLPSSGGHIYILEGEYTVSGSIEVPDNVTIQGAGATSVIKVRDGHNSNLNVVTNKDLTNGNQGIAIKDIRLDGNMVNQSSGEMRGIYLFRVEETKVSSVRASGFQHSASGSGVAQYSGVITVNSGLSTGSSQIVIDGNIITNNSSAGVLVYEVGGTVTVSNNTLGGNSGYGITSAFSNDQLTITNNNITGSGQAGIYLRETYWAQVSGNNSSSNEYGILFSNAYYNNISANSFNNNSDTGIRITLNSGSNSITGNTTTSNGGDGISSTEVNTNTVTGNTVEGNDGNGISLMSYNFSPFEGHVVSGNTISGNLEYAILLEGPGHNVTGNNIRNHSTFAVGDGGIRLVGEGADTSITSNRIINGAGYAIDIFASTVERTYLADNNITGSGNGINDDGTDTIYANQEVNGNLIVQPQGNFGVGTTNPQETLHVAGNGLFDGTVTADAFIGDGSGLTNLNASNISSGILSVGHGGTGVDSFTQFGLLYGNGSSSLGVTSAGATDECLVGNNGNAPSWVDCTIVGEGAEPGGTAGGDLSGTYPNPTVARINGASLGTTTADAGRILIGSGSQWISRALSGDVLVNSTGTTTLSNTAVSSGSYGSASQVATFQVNPQGRLVDAGQVNIAINGNQVTSGTVSNARLVNSGALTVNAGTGLSGGGSVALGGSTTINLNTTYLNNNYFAQGGNAFGATATMGTTDNNALRLITNNTEAMRVDASGNVGINTTNPQRTLDVSGEARIQGSDPNTVSMVVEGAIDQTGGILEVRTNDNTPVLFAGTESVQELGLNWVYTDDTNSLAAVAISPDGNTVYIGGYHDEVHAVDASDGSWQWTYSGHSDAVTEITVSPDGNTIYSGSQDTEVHAIDASTGTQDWDYTGHSSGWVYGLVVSPDGNSVYSGTTSSGEVHALNASNGSFQWDYTGHSGNWVRDLAISPNGEVLYTGANSIHAIDTTNSGAFLWDYTGHSGASQTLELNSDGSVLYSGARDDEVHAIDTSTEAQLWDYVHTGHVNAVIVSPDDSVVYAGSNASGGIRALDAANGNETWFYDGHSGNLSDLEISPNGETLYSTSIDNEAHAINLTFAEKLRVGIGTDSPETALHVAGDAVFRNETDQEQAFSIQDAAGNTLFNTDTSNNRLTLGTLNDEFKKIEDPSTLPPARSNGVGWSPDGKYMAIAHEQSPYITIYKRDGDTFTKLSNPSTLPTGNGQGVSWSPDGRYMSVAHNTSPFVTIYKRDGDTFTKLSNPSTLPASTGYETAWSPDGQYMSVAHASSPYVTVYRRTADTFSIISNFGSSPAGHGRSVAWSPSSDGGHYLAVGHDNSPYVTTYLVSGSFMFDLADPSTLPTGAGWGVTWSPDGKYLNVAHVSSPYISNYEVDYDAGSTSFTKLSDPNDLPGSIGYNASWSPDGRYMAVSHSLAPRFTIYQYNNGTFTKVPDPDDLPPSVGWDIEFSPDGRYLSVAHSNSPYTSIYRYGSSTTIHGSVEIKNIVVNRATVNNNLVVGGTIHGQAENGGALALSTGRQSGTIAQFVTGSNGNVCQVTTSFSCSSDERLKTNIEDMSAEESLDKIMQLGSVNFNWLQDPDGSMQSGFIAQQVQEIMPELVETSENGYLTLDKAGFVPYLVGGMQRQQGQIISLQGENASQTSLLDLITERVDDMEEHDIDNLTAELVNHESRLDSIEDKLASHDFGATTQSASTDTSYLQNGDSASFSSLNVSDATTLGQLTVSDTAVFEGEVVVQELEVETDLYVGGRVVSHGEEPEAELPELLEDIAEVVITGTDMTGRIEIKIDDELDEEDEEELKNLKRLTHVIFNEAFNEGTRMQVHLTPANSAGAGLGIYADMDDDSGEKFSIRILEELEPGRTYRFSYLVNAAEISQDD